MIGKDVHGLEIKRYALAETILNYFANCTAAVYYTNKRNSLKKQSCVEIVFVNFLIIVIKYLTREA